MAIKAKTFLGGKWIKWTDGISGDIRYRLIVPGKIEGEGYYVPPSTEGAIFPDRFSVQICAGMVTDRAGFRARVYGLLVEDCTTETIYADGEYRTVKAAQEAAEKAAWEMLRALKAA